MTLRDKTTAENTLHNNNIDKENLSKEDYNDKIFRNRVKTTKNSNRKNLNNMNNFNNLNNLNNLNNIDNYNDSTSHNLNEKNNSLSKSKKSSDELEKDKVNRSHYNSFSLAIDNNNFLLKSNKSSFAESNVPSRESTSSFFVSSVKPFDNFKLEVGKIGENKSENEASRQTQDKTKRKANKFKSAKAKKNMRDRVYEENNLDSSCFEV